MLRRFFELPWSSIPSWLVGNRLMILMYHSISENLLDPHAIPPGKFRQQMCFLKTRQVVSLQVALELLNGGSSLRNTYVITFDDALLDFYTNAIPILREFDYPVTMFVPTGLVGSTAIWDSFDPSKQLMNWTQIEECQQWNVTFGSHTVHHTRLTQIPKNIMQEELNKALQMLRNKIDNVFPALAYPGGYHNSIVHSEASRAGYICGLGTFSRWGNGPESDFFQLRRVRFET